MMNTNANKKAFTLIELLVVIAIIALLLAILMPSLSRARVLAVRVQCNANLHAVQASSLIYTNDFDECFPSRDDPKTESGRVFSSTPQYMRSGATDGGNPYPWILDRIFFKPYMTDMTRAIYCPGMLKNRTPDNYLSSKGAGSYSYYNYTYPYNNYTLANKPSYLKPPVALNLTKVSTAPINAPMWACLTVATPSDPVAPPNVSHDYDRISIGQFPEGMNCARAGGNSDWVNWPGNRNPSTDVVNAPDAIESFYDQGTRPYYWPTFRN